MNGFAIILGYLAIWIVVALVIAVLVGKFLGRRRPAEVEDWDPAPRNLTPRVPDQWKPDAEGLRDTPRDPSDPAS